MGRAQQPYSTPLPASQWADVPLPYRPKHWTDDSDRCALLGANTEYDRHQPSSIGGARLSGARSTGPPRARRRPDRNLDLSCVRPLGPDRSAFDETLLYPQREGYAPRYDLPSTRRRTVSQPNSPRSFQQQFAEAEPPMLGSPRSPTYPPSGRGRMHSVISVNDAAFHDEEDFRLFVDATAGLGPETAFLQQSSASLGIQLPRRSVETGQQWPSTDDASSPSTVQALAHLAQMPRAGWQYHPSTRQRAQAATDLWPSLPMRPRSNVPVMPLGDEDEDDDDLLPPNDELPNYAESQAQAQAGQRVEAARRAQELQRRWQARS
ncbi:hypothetical protein LTR62_007891 [Meristemomyces frigidus]|uniref:Uncharacterized protein n=1 Tax=Meristemomyces frigidus TaxID=1508187 RepID=A0AAN7TB71_9PEZI|nr:hypothetical protein LTR62_007891 [Meristemomyces frigidus]